MASSNVLLYCATLAVAYVNEEYARIQNEEEFLVAAAKKTAKKERMKHLLRKK